MTGKMFDIEDDMLDDMNVDDVVIEKLSTSEKRMCDRMMDIPRDWINQQVSFIDINTPERKRVIANIYIDKKRNKFKFIATDCISLKTFAAIIAGNKQIRYIPDEKRDPYVITCKNRKTYCTKKIIRRDGKIEIYDLETLIDTQGNPLKGYFVKETGWLSLSDVGIIDSDCNDGWGYYGHYKTRRKILFRDYKFEYCCSGYIKHYDFHELNN